MSGYTVVKELNMLTGEKFKQGTIYPLLYEMEKNGYISSQWTQKGNMKIKKYALSEDDQKMLIHLRDVFSLPLKEAMNDIMGKKAQTNH
jgi:DNA-binding PadR family transcriptional regulator